MECLNKNSQGRSPLGGQGDFSPGHFQRCLRKARPILLLFALGFAYLIFYNTFGIGIPCVFRKLTGLQCPGCGMTHAMAELSRGNFKGAMEYNALSLTALPVVVIYLFYRFIPAERGNEKDFYIWEYILLAVLLLIALSYGYLRNQ